MRLRNLNLASRAGLFFALIIALMCVLGAVAVIQMGKLHDAEKDVELNWMASIQQTARMNDAALRMRLETLRGLADPTLIAATLSGFPVLRKALTEAIANYAPLVASEKENGLYQSVKVTAEAYSKQLDLLEPLLARADIPAALTLIRTNIRPLTDRMSAQIKDLADLNNEGATTAGQYANTTYSTALWFIAFMIMGVILLTIALAAVLTKSITTPIGDALSVAERIADSNLSQPVNVSGTDEAGRLLKALAKMQENLRGTIMQISESSTQLASATEKMTTVTEASSRGLVAQNDEVSQAATAVTEMSAAVDEVARNAESASEESRRTQGFTEAGLERVGQTLKSIQRLSGNVETTSDKIQVLSQRAQNINKVVEVIRAIAEQTNLLALNAAIEAARAGEQGRGFAVVADEVRALAHRTQSSTQEIEQMIAAMQSDSAEAVDAMSKSKELATQTLDVAQEANDSLDQIAKAISLINERNLQIATASEEQAHVAREVDRNLISIRALAVQSTTGANQTTTACNELSKLANNLEKMVSRFVV